MTKSLWKHELSVQRGISVKTIDDVLRRARGVIAEPSLQHIKSMMDESLRLFLSGEQLASMWAGQATWEAAASINYALGDLPLHESKWKEVAGGKKGAEIKKQKRGDSELRARVVTAIQGYKGSDRNMASIIARKLKCSDTYVRQIKRELNLP